MGLAVTSQNLAVPDNLKYSEEVYNYFKRNRRFPEKGFGSKAGSIKRNFEKANMLIDKLGSMEAFTDFLQTEFTVGQLNPILKGHLGKKAKVGGELVGAKVYGSAVFGPKIGNGFYTNLLDELHVPSAEPPQSTPAEPKGSVVLGALSETTPQAAEELAGKLSCSVQEVLLALFDLEARGIVVLSDGGYIRLPPA